MFTLLSKDMKDFQVLIFKDQYCLTVPILRRIMKPSDGRKGFQIEVSFGPVPWTLTESYSTLEKGRFNSSCPHPKIFPIKPTFSPNTSDSKTGDSSPTARTWLWVKTSSHKTCPLLDLSFSTSVVL